MTDQHFYMDGRLLTIVRYENETDAQFSERSSFILSFRNNPNEWPRAIELSQYHINKMFYGYTYDQKIENELELYRGIHRENISTVV